MPLIQSNYKAPLFFGSGHLQTVYSPLFRRVPFPNYRRERLELSDGDFLDLDWVENQNNRLAIISHGMEASSQAVYVCGMVDSLVQEGWDVLAWNFRGCGGEPNRLPRMYHSGASDDLAAVVQHVVLLNRYSSIALVGFSMGGNLTLKYLGETSELPREIKAAVVISVPCDLAAAAALFEGMQNLIYMRRFLNFFRRRIEEKCKRFPRQFSMAGFSEIRNFRQFDDRYTAPLHGFSSAEDYWKKSSSYFFLDNIRIPTLILNAEDDSFLAGECYPVEKAKASQWIFLEMPKDGGHVGFISFSESRQFWSERRCGDFLHQFTMPQT